VNPELLKQISASNFEQAGKTEVPLQTIKDADTVFAVNDVIDALEKKRAAITEAKQNLGDKGVLQKSSVEDKKTSTITSSTSTTQRPVSSSPFSISSAPQQKTIDSIVEQKMKQFRKSAIVEARGRARDKQRITEGIWNIFDIHEHEMEKLKEERDLMAKASRRERLRDDLEEKGQIKKQYFFGKIMSEALTFISERTKQQIKEEVKTNVQQTVQQEQKKGPVF
jgi:hypothetical protein